MTFQAYAAPTKGALLAPFSYQPAPLGPDDVEVRIEHCGICHSDLHLLDNDWGFSSYPFVPGHEIVGVVEAVGSAVTHLTKGARVGVGWQRGACLACELCTSGRENLCGQQRATCVGHHGGFADRIRVDSRFAFALPSALDPAAAAPLLCGGITVFSPLLTFGVQPGQRVGVVGIGGLGHLALQFARAWGCEVTAFSSSPSKEAEARAFGAHHYVLASDRDALAKARGSQDFILSTVSADIDWAAYAAALRPDGTLCVVGASPGAVSVPAFELLTGRKRIAGSPIGSRHHMQEMLRFAALHNVAAKTEQVPLAEVNEALTRVRANRARYRIVLTMPR